MKISELVAVAQKVASVAGDAEIKLKHVEGELESEIKGFETLVSSAENIDQNLVTLVHGPANGETSTAPAES